ncbi:MAG: T9SS type A sorting domain-containing protein [Chitinophagales bacterium]|nr:T9SS type A sorting domain-containing protein [Chitinophagales bacterium]
MKNLLFLLLLSFTYASFGQVTCDTSLFVKARVSMNDQWNSGDLSWEFVNDSGRVVKSGAVNTTAAFCLPKDCYNFNLKDASGDGFQNGYCRVFLNDEKVLEVTNNFGTLYQYSFGCAEGEVCEAPIPLLSTGSFVTAYENTWYSFSPIETGRYEFEACNNSCNTGIWIYDVCPARVNDQVTGTVAFANSGCTPTGAKLVANLIKGKTYTIRIGDINNHCSATALNWSFSYLGPIVGCLDPQACNYNPAATIAGDCIYPGDPNCTKGPDLILDSALVRSSMKLKVINNSDNCTVQEKCVSGYGPRYVIRFSTRILNRGDKDYFIGSTPDDPLQSNEQFQWDPCHDHWHYYGYAEYALYDSLGVKVPVGFKNGFCVLDLDCQGGGQQKYSCGYMGISHGCEDIYDSELDCQWIDITNVDTGDYTFVVRINYDRSPDAAGSVEQRYDNNDAYYCIHIGRNAQNKPTYQFRNDCPQFTDCSGEPFGIGQPDCEGICKGFAKIGDYNKDRIINQPDVEAYFTASLNREDAVPCNDLNADGTLNIADAALAQDCHLKGENYVPPTGGLQDHCEFPNLIANWQDTAFLEMSTPNGSYIDVFIRNPNFSILGWQFSMKGIQIDSVLSLISSPLYNTHLDFNSVTGNIASLSYNELLINSSNVPQPFLRVFYSLPENEVCIDTVHAIVNDKYERVSKVAGACKTLTRIFNNVTPLNSGIYPNPLQHHATLTFSNPKNESFLLEIIDLQGKIIDNFGLINGSKYELNQLNYTPGIYFYRLSGSVVEIGKMVIR